MGLNAQDLSDDDAREPAAFELNIILDLGGRERELIDELQIVKTAQVDKVLDPIH